MEEHCYIVIYDLCRPGMDYNSLIRAIKQYHRWGKISKSAWAIVTDKTSEQIRDELRDFMDKNDRLMVVRSGKDAAWTNAFASDQWVKENLIK